MKKIKITKEFEGVEIVCEKCGKVIVGNSENQVNYWMKIHQMSSKCIKRK